ncbi:MAG: DUF3822 family protein [Bacteroidales bacterium]|nr:DUF3822 family protein [Bacteroidales bacterium]
MQSFAFTDETIDINSTQSYKLSIQLNLNGLSFCVFDVVRNKYIVLQHIHIDPNIDFTEYLNTIENILDSVDLLKYSYKKVRLIWYSGKSTLIPSNLFNTEKLKQYFEFNQELDDLDEIHYTELKYANAYSVFTMPNQVANIFVRKYPQITFFNQQALAIENALYKYSTNDYKVILNVNEDTFDLIIIQKGYLILYNNFIYTNEVDILYYVMYSFEQLQIDSRTIEVICSGYIAKNSKMHLKLNEFIRNIKFDKYIEDYSYSYTFNKIPQHYFTNLFNLHLCE